MLVSPAFPRPIGSPRLLIDAPQKPPRLKFPIPRGKMAQNTIPTGEITTWRADPRLMAGRLYPDRQPPATGITDGCSAHFKGELVMNVRKWWVAAAVGATVLIVRLSIADDSKSAA